LRGKLSVVGEFFRPARKDGGEETVRAFGERRLGREFTEIMLDSMVSGIHAGDISRLSLPAAFPKIAALERDYGGLFKGMIQKRKEAKREAKTTGTKRTVEAGPSGILHSFDRGMAVPIEALGESLAQEDLLVATRATKIEKLERGFRVFLSDSLGEGSTLDADAVVLACPAPGMAQILDSLVPDAAAALSQVALAGVHVVCLAYEQAQIGGDVRGFGALIPRSEGLRTLGVLYVHATFSGHAPSDRVLLRAMVGGRHDPRANELGDEELRQLVRGELTPLLRIEGEPTFQQNFRWNEGIPQYELGHLSRISSARAALKSYPGIFLTGNSICGIAFNSCVAHSEEIGREVAEYLLAARGLEEASC
jgi:oxygen-dependent protoporphyrinogen oxidase